MYSTINLGHLLTSATQDNGVKLVDPRGEMLEAAWEGYATTLANTSSTEEFIDALDQFVKTLRIDLSKPARVVFGRDTRPSGPSLVAALEDGLQAIGAEARDAGVTTTPILHYLVRATNTKGTKDPYGEDTTEGYYDKISTAFKKLVVRCHRTNGFLDTHLVPIDRKSGVTTPRCRLREWRRRTSCLRIF